MAELADYTDLITSEHTDRPDFLAVLTAVLTPMVDVINVIESMPAKYDMDAAVGVQLDTIGRWVGISRNLLVPITDVFFSLDTVGLGFNEGIWYSYLTPGEELATMDDGTYRLMIRGKIAANIWDGSLGNANEMLYEIFPGADVQLQDNFDMSQTFIVSGSAPSALFEELVAQGYIPLRPAAVNLT